MTHKKWPLKMNSLDTALPNTVLPFIDLHALFALTGISLLLAACVLRLLLWFKIAKGSALIIALVIFAISYLSVSGYAINIYLYGIINDLSISSLVLLSYYFIASGTALSASRSNTLPVFYLLLAAGLFFYPAALGFGIIDPYSWGFINKTPAHYSSLILIVCLAALMVFSFIRHYHLLLLCLVLATLAYQLNILASRNLWDYLLDPLIFIYALFVITSRLIKK